MPKAIVAIPADIRHFDGYDWHASPVQYASAALAAADVVPLIVPAFGPGDSGLDIIDSILDRVDGVLISGARTNVDPKLYDQLPDEANGPYDPDRDATSMALIRRTIERAIPLLAICRGIQELNVAFGGTLATEIQEQDGNLDHRYPESDDRDIRFSIRHPVTVEPNGRLHKILGARSIEVNSLHRQAIGQLAPGLELEAQAPDGVVEAVSVAEAAGFAIGVQWHPEYWATTDDPSRHLFEAFGKAARDFANARHDQVAA